MMQVVSREETEEIFLKDVPLRSLPYQVKHHVGSGAFAHVYAAASQQNKSQREQPAGPKHVALKVFRSEFNGIVNEPREEALMLSEAFCLKRIRHPCIVECYDVCYVPAAKTSNLKVREHPDHALTMVMEYLEGGSLARLTYKQMTEPHRKIISDSQALALLLDVARGLTHMHSQDPPIMHRDVKQENVLITNKGGKMRAKIADFGLHVKLDRAVKQSVLRRKRCASIKSLASVADTPKSPNPTNHRNFNFAKLDLRAVEEEVSGHLSTSGVQLHDADTQQERANSISCMDAQLSSSGVFFSPATHKGHLFSSGRLLQARQSSKSHKPQAQRPNGAVAECLQPTPIMSSDAGPERGCAAAACSCAAPAVRSIITSIPNACSSHSTRERAVEQLEHMHRHAAAAADADAARGSVALGTHKAGKAMEQDGVQGQHTATAQADAHPAPPASETSSQDPICLAAPPLPSVFSAAQRHISWGNQDAPAVKAFWNASPAAGCPAHNVRNADLTSTPITLAGNEDEVPSPESLPLLAHSPVFMPGLTALAARQSPLPNRQSPQAAPQTTAPRSVPIHATILSGQQQPKQQQQQVRSKSVGRASGDTNFTADGQAEQGGEDWDTPITPIPAKVLATMASIGRTTLIPHAHSVNSTTSAEASKHGGSIVGRVLMHNKSRERGVSEGMSAEKAEVKRLLAPEFQWVFNLTAETGSLAYMAPEVYRGEPYNQAADVYSFGVLMYEVLNRSMLILTYVNAGRHKGFSSLDDYARAASQGFRPERTKDIQDDVWQLITMCWDQDPLERPTMDVVVARLEDICDKLPSTCHVSAPQGEPSCHCSIS